MLLLGVISAAALELSLPAGEAAEPWRAELALVEAGLPLPAGAEIEIVAVGARWSVHVVGADGHRFPAFEVERGPGGVREALWVSAALLRANRPQVGWMLPPPEPPPPAPRPVPPVPAPVPAPVPPPPVPPAPEPVPAPVPATVPVPVPVPMPVPPTPESGPTELALGVLVGSDAAWGVGLKLRVGAEAWSVEVRAEGQHLRAPARATLLGLDASRTVLGGSSRRCGGACSPRVPC